MRKLKLQMQVTVDGFVAGPGGRLDWMTFDMDDKLLGFINQLTDSSDTILMGRKMAAGFVTYWEAVKPDSLEYAFARKMIDIPKIVFSRTVKNIPGQNVRVESSDLVKAVTQLKSLGGKDLVVYGGAQFVSSLIGNDLIDEFNFFVNPTAIGKGLRVFEQGKQLKLTTSTAYRSGIVINTYERRA